MIFMPDNSLEIKKNLPIIGQQHIEINKVLSVGECGTWMSC